MNQSLTGVPRAVHTQPPLRVSAEACNPTDGCDHCPPASQTESILRPVANRSGFYQSIPGDVKALFQEDTSASGGGFHRTLLDQSRNNPTTKDPQTWPDSKSNVHQFNTESQRVTMATNPASTFLRVSRKATLKSNTRPIVWTIWLRSHFIQNNADLRHLTRVQERRPLDLLEIQPQWSTQLPHSLLHAMHSELTSHLLSNGCQLCNQSGIGSRNGFSGWFLVRHRLLRLG